ncbi:MAG: HEPN domain-containing protein [Nitrososphaeria archaeon]
MGGYLGPDPKSYLDYAKEDLQAAKYLYHKDMYRWSVFCLQQAQEKTAKALLMLWRNSGLREVKKLEEKELRDQYGHGWHKQFIKDSRRFFESFPDIEYWSAILSEEELSDKDKDHAYDTLLFDLALIEMHLSSVRAVSRSFRMTKKILKERLLKAYPLTPEQMAKIFLEANISHRFTLLLPLTELSKILHSHASMSRYPKNIIHYTKDSEIVLRIPRLLMIIGSCIDYASHLQQVVGYYISLESTGYVRLKEKEFGLTIGLGDKIRLFVEDFFEYLRHHLNFSNLRTNWLQEKKKRVLRFFG